MDLLERTLKNSYDYAIHRMDVLCKLGTIEDIEDAESIRQEFKEWIKLMMIMIYFLSNILEKEVILINKNYLD